MMEYLPCEIVLDILSRLSVTSLLQFKLVCKSWHNLTQDPLLVSMHFYHAPENDPCLIVHCDHPIRNQLYSLELSDPENDQRVNKLRVPMFPEFDIKGSCKGLLCLCDSSTRDSLYAYNPFTRNYIELPKSIDETLYDLSLVFGFGFNQTTKEYKVVKVVYWRIRPRYPRHFSIMFSLQSEVQVFTLGKPSWRSLGKIPHFLYAQGPSQVLVNGRLHWTTWPRRYHIGCMLISFDLEDEQFREVPKPDSGGLERLHFDAVELGGCLAGVLHQNYGQLEIWVMKEYDVKESWIKEFNIAIHVPRGLKHADRNSAEPFRDSKFYRKSSFVRVLGLLKNGEVLLEYKCRALVTYDQKDGTFKDLTFPEMPYWFEAVIHEGSLNWIDSLTG
ncbi:hypothetical protein LWI28_024138 [Acer negundo]|uniref:F-box domain-containing protein n=1 Tax=Acer negundo TaxID=4023 RepID=A0AAD5IXH3_ACENE|nr:hypothetical protein LWI28_013531 [Acer negundo]KAI9178231.1 hypothetical protein LWI28_024138 [Acer negundo]KAK4846516.1 hypothetical protein QYF36_018415 [Acer negundo]